jgi:hypothetical protein
VGVVNECEAQVYLKNSLTVLEQPMPALLDMIRSTSETAAAGLIVLILLLVKALAIGKRGHELPPGPATLPLREFCTPSLASVDDSFASVGNLHIFPSEHPYYKSVLAFVFLFL